MLWKNGWYGWIKGMKYTQIYPEDSSIAGEGGCVCGFENSGIGDIFNYRGRTSRDMVKWRAGLD